MLTPEAVHCLQYNGRGRCWMKGLRVTGDCWAVYAFLVND